MPNEEEIKESKDLAAAEVVEEVNLLFGIPEDSFRTEKHRVKYGESFAQIFQEQGVDYQKIHTIATEHKDVFDVSKIRQGKYYTLFKSKNDTAPEVKIFVYQPNLVDYYVVDLQDSIRVFKGKKEVQTRRREVAGVINSSLYEAMLKSGGSVELAMMLSDVYAWSIDFFRIQKGDYFKVIYTEKFIDDTLSVGIDRIKASEFSHSGESFYGFLYGNDSIPWDYFDEKGKNLRKAFLRAPLQFSRISSRYNPRRYHPVLKTIRPHLGTDYAAPRGTPIMSTADGKVIAASYTRGNGNYVKVRHNSTYTTQYLHMTRIADGIRRGEVVRQGEVIGYVGSTGLATGPHVCYRFWKHGKQVDPYKQKLPEADPIDPRYKEDYLEKMEVLKKDIDNLPLPEESAKDQSNLAGMPQPLQ